MIQVYLSCVVKSFCSQEAVYKSIVTSKDNHMERYIGKSPLNPSKSRSDILASKEVPRSNHPDNRYVAMSRSEARSGTAFAQRHTGLAGN